MSKFIDSLFRLRPTLDTEIVWIPWAHILPTLQRIEERQAEISKRIDERLGKVEENHIVFSKKQDYSLSIGVVLNFMAMNVSIAARIVEEVSKCDALTAVDLIETKTNVFNGIIDFIYFATMSFECRMDCSYFDSYSFGWVLSICYD